jgi:hypothetical protein
VEPVGLSGIPREVVEHSLDILPHSRVVQQRLRRFDEERRRAIGVELQKLLEAGFIKEVFHPTWLANPVLIKKKNGKWRMSVHYTGLNKACPKVPFPLPQINQIIDSTAGCELLCFLDAYFGYCRMDLPGPTTSVGTKTDYSVGPWDYPTCAARYLMA